MAINSVALLLYHQFFWNSQNHDRLLIICARFPEEVVASVINTESIVRHWQLASAIQRCRHFQGT
jgi:hypothetical protein